MKRIKAIDNIRGIAIFIMVLSHTNGWIMNAESYWLAILIDDIVEDFVAAGFILTSGISTMISYRGRVQKAKISSDYNERQIRNEYYLRAFFIICVGLMYNSVNAIRTLDPLAFWKWFIPLTVGVALMLVFPFLKLSIMARIIISIAVWVVHFNVLWFLSPYAGQANANGLIYYILYNSIDLHPVIYYFSFVLIGTVIGDIIFKIYLIEDDDLRNTALKKRMFYPALIIGPTLIIFGVIFQFPNFMVHASISATVYVIGIIFLMLSVLMYFEENHILETKKRYPFFFYYSYYSFTIFLVHNAFFFIFHGQLNVYNFVFYLAILSFLFTLLLRAIYKSSWRNKFSIKVQVSLMATSVANNIEAKRKLKLENIAKD